MEVQSQQWRPRKRFRQAKLEIELPHHLAAGSMARREIGRCFEGTLSDAVLIDLKLVAHELVTNAVVHGVGEVGLKVHAMADHVRVEITDAGDGFTAPFDPSENKGLAIVDRIADRWGVTAGSTHVWCHLPVPVS